MERNKMTLLTDEPLHAKDSVLHCSAVWHITRLKGKGSNLAFPLYERSCAVAGTRPDSKFFARITQLAPYFDASYNRLLDAAHLLVDSGWWALIELRRGHACIYRPVRHGKLDDLAGSWLETHPDCCCGKFIMPWTNEEHEDELPRQLWKVTGGMDWRPNVAKGLRKYADDEDLVELATTAMDYMHMVKGSAKFRERVGMPSITRARKHHVINFIKDSSYREKCLQST
jgi:hypothetical protein